MRGHADERGRTVLSTLIIGVVIGAVVIGVFSNLAPDTVVGPICRAVSGLLGTDLGCAPPPQRDRVRRPDTCQVRRIPSAGTSYDVSFVPVGRGTGFLATRYSDGTVTLMAATGTEAGATGGLGVENALQQMRAGAKVDFGAGLVYDYGATWAFPTLAAADTFQADLHAYLDAHASGAAKPGAEGPKPPPVPSATFDTMTALGSVTDELGLALPRDARPAAAGELDRPALVAGVTPLTLWTVTNHNAGTPEDPADDARTYVADLELDVNDAISVGPGASGVVLGISLSVRKDAAGQIVDVTIVDTSEIIEVVPVPAGTPGTGFGSGISGGPQTGQLVTTETRLVLDPTDVDAQRTVREWMRGAEGYGWPGGLPAGVVDPSGASKPGDPFAVLLHERAVSSTVVHDHVTDKRGFALKVKVGLALGVDFSAHSTDSSAAYVTHRGAPATVDDRPTMDYTTCAPR